MSARQIHLSRDLTCMTDVKFSEGEQSHEVAARIVVHKKVDDTDILKGADEVDDERVLENLQNRTLVLAMIELKELENAAAAIRHVAFKSVCQTCFSEEL